MENPQLTFALSLRDDATFSNFCEGDNAQLLSCLRGCIAGHGERIIYLWGESGVGRSHLLQACCHEIEDQKSAVYLSFKENEDLAPAILDGLEYTDLVCLDDIDSILGDAQWEEALFHFYNRARDQKTRLLVVGDVAPTQLACQLPDLVSRLAWGLVFQVKALDDAQKITAIQLHAHNRGMTLSEEVGRYLLHHCPRSMSALFDVLAKLEKSSLVEQRRITVPFVKQILAHS
jgi:DnaA-homolog protein